MSKQLHACSLALPSVSAVSCGGLQPWHFFKHVFTCPGIGLLASVLHNSNLLIEEQATRQISSLIFPQSFKSFFSSMRLKEMGSTVEGNTTRYLPGNTDLSTI